MSRKFYKEPTIVKANKGWFISYYFEYPDQPGKFKRFYVKDGINYVHDLAERERQAELLRGDISHALAQGYNPFKLVKKLKRTLESKQETIRKVKEDATLKPWTMNKAIAEFLAHVKWKNLSENTLRSYRTFINNVQEWMEAEGVLEEPASKFTEAMMYDFLNEYNSDRTWSPRTYNNHALFFITFFNLVKKLEKKANRAIQYEFDSQEVELKADRAEKNRYYTDIVLDQVKKELDKNQDLYNYAKWIFYSCMRPREIRLLRIQHIDLKNRQIKAIAPTAKTGDRFVPISDELYDLIVKMDLAQKPSGWFVFSDSMKPGPNRHTVNRMSDHYRKIKDRLSLDHNYTLYSFKHTRCVNLLQAGFTDQEVMSLTGHTDAKSFETYKRSLTIDAKAMKGKTIDF